MGWYVRAVKHLDEEISQVDFSLGTLYENDVCPCATQRLERHKQDLLSERERVEAWKESSRRRVL